MSSGTTSASTGAPTIKDQPSLAERRNRPYPVDWFRRCHGDERDQGRGQIPPSIVEEVSTINRDACLPGSNEWAGSSDGYEFSTGGPLRRDKFWFFIGASEFDDAYSERLLGGDPYDVSLFADARILKLNMQPSASHSFAASGIDTPAFRNYFNWQSYDYWTPTPHENDSVLSTISWNWALSSNWFLEAKIADQETQENKLLACHNRLEQENPAAQAVDGIPILEWLSQDNYPETPARMVETCLQAKSLDRGSIAGHTATNTSGGDTSYPLRFPFDPSKGIFYPGNNYNVYRDAENLSSWHNGWILSDGFGFNAFPREQANAGLTHFAGANHELKYGFDYQDTKWEGENARVPLMQGWGFDPTNPFGYLGAGTIADDTCATPFTRTGTSAHPRPDLLLRRPQLDLPDLRWQRPGRHAPPADHGRAHQRRDRPHGRHLRRTRQRRQRGAQSRLLRPRPLHDRRSLDGQHGPAGRDPGSLERRSPPGHRRQLRRPAAEHHLRHQG